jgi:pimeloyl-ACP methyl ester carboxylesterase
MPAAVWHTPLLQYEFVVESIRRATAPCLLVGGTADPTWDGGVARQLSPHVLEIDGANHGMFIEDSPLAESAAVMGRVATAVENFLDSAVWV